MFRRVGLRFRAKHDYWVFVVRHEWSIIVAVFGLVLGVATILPSEAAKARASVSSKVMRTEPRDWERGGQSDAGRKLGPHRPPAVECRASRYSEAVPTTMLQRERPAEPQFPHRSILARVERVHCAGW